MTGNVPSNTAPNSAATGAFTGPVFDTCATDAMPQHLAEGESNVPGSLVATAGVDDENCLKASRWHCSFDGTCTSPDPNYFSLVLHRGGGQVWKNDDPTDRAIYGTASIHSWREKSMWHCNNEVSYTHFYLPVALVEHIANQKLERLFEMDEIEDFFTTDNTALITLMRAMDNSLFEYQDASALALDSWGLLLSQALLSHFSYKENSDLDRNFGKLPCPNLKRVVEYIDANLAQDLSLDALAGVAAMSTFHFARRFKETTGHTPHAYVMRRRSFAVQKLLKSSTLELAQIAYQCGFSNQSHMTTILKQLTGHTPARLRQILRH